MAGDLLAILSQASTSLGTHRAAAATASQNIANVNTPGYSRQTANLEALTPADFAGNAFIGRGVGLQSITQARDLFLERQVPSAISSKGFSSTESDALAAVSALDPDGGDGLTSALGAFYAAMRGAAQNPNDPGLRQAAVSAAQALTRSFNRTAQALEDTRNGVDAKLAGTVNDVNQTAAAMADLNKQIRVARASGGEPNDLLDARQRLQDKLTQLTGAVPVTNDKGDVSMALPGGTTLVSDDRAATLSVTPDASNGGHLALQLTRTDGSGPVTLAGTAVGGAMGGAISARDGAILTAKNGIDTLAFDLGNTINAIHKCSPWPPARSARRPASPLTRAWWPTPRCWPRRPPRALRATTETCWPSSTPNGPRCRPATTRRPPSRASSPALAAPPSGRRPSPIRTSGSPTTSTSSANQPRVSRWTKR
jgi:flagellar hook-associated protein 1 FlgK